MQICFITFDLCCFGKPYKKSQLKGTERVRIGGQSVTRNKSTGAGTYPVKLCRLWAQVARQIGPEGSRRETADRTGWKAQNSADEPDHPNWKGTAEGDKEPIREAKDFIQQKPVIFG